ncbi:MAG: T9SS type A sorting domain-containing protein [Saprospiraceae bacterium]|nr:T9SS type A sorting domain-containing protein [Saprospiraceae bacterium]
MPKFLCNPRIGFALSLFVFLLGASGLKAQVIINEIDPNGTIEIKNIGTNIEPIANYFLCEYPNYAQLSTLTVECGSLALEPGQLVVVSGFPLGGAADGELAFYISNQFTNPNAIIDYVEWGSTGHVRSSVAGMAGIWSLGDFVPSWAGSASLEYDGTGNDSGNWTAVDVNSLCAENASIAGCEVSGGSIFTTDPTVICAGDGIPDPIDVDLIGASGTNSGWVITDVTGTILSLPVGPPFNLEGAGGGICQIWHISYEDDLEGAGIGENTNDLTGCFELSNAITVTRNGVNGGSISTTDPVGICTGDGVSDPINVSLSGNEGSNSAWVITDNQSNILALPAGPPFDLEGAGPGICFIWHLSFEDGLIGAEVGLNADDLEGCFDLSNPIQVTRTAVDGGEISTTDPTEICAGDGVADPIDVSLSGNIGLNSAWVITDADGTILALPAGPPFDLEGAGGGTCLIWHISFDDDLDGAVVGNNASDLTGCFDLSNPITVTRNGVNGGILSTDDATTLCVGDGSDDLIDISVSGSEGSNSAWVITDAMGMILELPVGPPFNFENAGPGISLIWHLSFEDGLVGAEVGLNANDLEGCFDLSEPIVVTRYEGFTTGGTISTTDPTDICVGDAIPNPINVTLEGNTGTNSAWLITDDLGNILALPAGPPFDLEGAGGGTCFIWHLSYVEGIVGAVVGNNVTDIEGCFSLSNFISVTRNAVAGGVITTNSPTEICAGDGTADPINVTLTGSEGANSAWVITDQAGNILDLPAGPPFDLEGAGGGICLIWHLSFEDGLEGAVIGNNATELSGCFDLSNPIEVTRTGVDGGSITTSDPTTICVSDGVPDLINVTLTGEEGANSAWVITDQAGNILDLPAGPPFDLDGAGAGTCLIWHLSFEDGLEGAEVGQNASDLVGCYSLSNPITVVRNSVTGGEISTNDPTEICVGDGNPDPINVTLVGAVGSNSGWVITDEFGTILALPLGPPFDLETAGGGTCLIWHISFEDGLEGAELGMDAGDLSGCFELSNPITVTRTAVDGGDISTTDPTTICVGDGIPDLINVSLTGTEGANSMWIIADGLGNILDLPAGPPFDLDGTGAGTAVIWHLSFEDGLEGAEVGLNINNMLGCFSLSNGIIVNRLETDGGIVTTTDGGDMVEVCVGDDEPDVIDFATTSLNLNYQYIITDENNVILDLPAGSSFDFEGAETGICRVWGIAYTGNLAAEIGENAAVVALSDQCYSLSSTFITVVRVDSGPNCFVSTFENQALSAFMRLSPNPVSDQLRLEIEFYDRPSGLVSLSIHDVVGKEVFTKIINDQAIQEELIDVSNFPAGVYILSLRDGKRINSKRFIVK